MTKDKALKLALEALEKWDARGRLRVIAAIKEALAPTSTTCEVQLEQKPVLWCVMYSNGEMALVTFRSKQDAERIAFASRKGAVAVALYTTPPAPPEQEPVAHMYADDYERMLNSETFCTVYSVAVGSPTRGETTIELYTTPPKREWVGLTDDDFVACSEAQKATVIYFLAKLKEKNHGL